MELLPSEDSDTQRIAAGPPSSRLVFWVDRGQVLRKIEYPLPRQAKTFGLLSVTVEFRDVSWEAADPKQFAPPPVDDSKIVSRFVPPPPPLPCEWLDRAPEDFFLTDSQGRKWTPKTEADRVQVLMWFNDHLSSRRGLLQLQRVRESLQNDPNISFYAVSAAEKSVSSASIQEQLQVWGAPLGLLRDLHSRGRDVFIAKFSLPRAARRLADAREELKIPATMRQARLQELQQQSRVGWALILYFLVFYCCNFFAFSSVWRWNAVRSATRGLSLRASSVPTLGCWRHLLGKLASHFMPFSVLASCISSGVDSVSFGRFLTVRKS